MPLRDDAAAWRTQGTRRTVVAVAHNVAAATRLLDVLPALAVDRRLQMIFTCPGSSPFTEGTEAFLARNGVMVAPWKEVISQPRPDLVITASYGGDLHELRSPLIAIPHGMGYNKYAKSANQQISKSANQQISKSVFGLSSDWLMHDGQLLPTVIVLSHDEQLDRLRAAVPVAAEAAVVTGDPCYDLLAASRPLRESYRQALGIRPGQRLVVVASTWGEDSLYGRCPSLPAGLATALPLDRYRVALALHPNIAAGHSRWQLDVWLADCAGAGVLVLPDEGLWRQAVVAADLAIGDHGSMTFYAAALGIPVLLASAPHHTVDPRSPIGRLLAVAPRLQAGDDGGLGDPRGGNDGWGRGLLAQVEEAIDGHDPDRLAAITGLITSHPGQADHRFREVVYGLLDLPPPADRVDDMLPVPDDVPGAEPRAQLVEAVIGIGTGTGGGTAGGDGDGGLVVDATRYAAGTLGERPPAGPAAHLVVDVRTPNTRLVELCDVMVHVSPLDARRWVVETLGQLPGCLVAMARAGTATWLAGTADGTLVRFDVLDDGGVPRRPHDSSATALASALHAWLVAGRSAASLPPRVTVRLATDTLAARTTVLPP